MTLDLQQIIAEGILSTTVYGITFGILIGLVIYIILQD